MDFVLEAWVSSLIDCQARHGCWAAGRPWKPGEKLKLLFAGYNGTRNTGSDVRVEEMLRQIAPRSGRRECRLQRDDPGFRPFQGIFRGHAPSASAQMCSRRFLSAKCQQHHGVVACEGSMFKSKFANALTTMMIGSLGIAVGRKINCPSATAPKPAHMDPLIRNMCARYCSDSLVITRNDESQALAAASLACPPNSAPIRRGLSSRYPPSTDSASCAKRAGTARRRYWWCARSSLRVAGESFNREIIARN